MTVPRTDATSNPLGAVVGGRAAVARIVVARIVVAGIVVAGSLSGCSLVADLPAARYACTADAPACPDGEVCIVDDRGDGVCGAFSVCLVDGGDGTARRAADGAPCPQPEGVTAPYGCSAGLCVELACGTAGYKTTCGDGCMTGGEECDDRNGNDGDGCARDCKREPGWQCVDREDPETGARETVGCTSVCGDGIIVGNEICDDGNVNPADGCDETCEPTTFAAAPLVSGSTEGIAAGTAELDLPLGIVADVEGVLFVADSRRHRILRFDPADGLDAEAIVIAGNGTPGFAGDGGPAREAQLCMPVGIGVDGFGNVFVADALNHRVRRIDRDGVITTIAGSTAPGDECAFGAGGSDDDSTGPASAARFNTPFGLAVDRGSGAVYVLDTRNLRVRRLEPVGPRDRPTSWNVRTVVGSVGNYETAVPYCESNEDCASGFCARDICLPTNITLGSAQDVAFNDGSQFGLALGPTGLALGTDGTLYIADTANMRIFRVPAGCIDGDGTPCSITATVTLSLTRLDTFSIPFAVHAVPVDGGGDRLVYSDIGYGAVLNAGRVALDARTAIVRAGTTGQPPLKTPGGVTSFGNDLFVVDANERRVLRVPIRGGQAEEVAGRPGIRIVDGVDANEVELLGPAQVAVDDEGALYSIESLAHVARRFSGGPTGGLVSTRVAGTGQLDLFALLGLTGRITSSRPTDRQCASLRDSLALGADASRGPEGIAVLPWVDAQGVARRSVLVGDTLAQQVLRFDDDGTVCDVVSVRDVGGEAFRDEFSPRFLHLHGRTLLIVDNGLGSIGASRIVRLTLRADGTPDPAQPLQAISLESDLASIADALPLDDGTFLVADPSAAVVWRYTSVFPVLAREAYVGVAGAPADDGGEASRAAARLFTPLGLAQCPDGRLVIADGGAADSNVGARVRVLSADGTRVSTLAGNGRRGLAGDFGPAGQARLEFATPKLDPGQDPPAVLAASIGVACAADGTVYVSGNGGGRIRRIAPDGTITTVAGRVAPAGPGPASRARLYVPVTFASGLPDAEPPSLVAVDGATGEGPGDGGGRVSVVDGSDDAIVRPALGYPRAATSAGGPALRAPLLVGAQGAAWDAARGRLVITQSRSTALRVVDIAREDPAQWTDLSPVELGEDGLAGIAIDPADGSFVVADEDDHCVRRLSADLSLDPSPDAAVAGTCGAADGALRAPTGVAFSRQGTLYVSDTGHNRVVRVDAPGPTAALVDVVGRLRTAASAGEGAPAAEQAVNAPRQLAFDAWDNLYISSTTTVRVVLNDDGDDPDGDDHVVTAFGAGGGDYPERDARCITAVAPLPANLSLPAGARSAIVVGDSCLGAAALLTVRSDR